MEGNADRLSRLRVARQGQRQLAGAGDRKTHKCESFRTHVSQLEQAALTALGHLPRQEVRAIAARRCR